MSTFHQFISERGFDRFRPGLEARFVAHGLNYRIVYSESAPFPSLLVLKQASREPDRPGNCFSIFFDLIRI